MRVWSRVAGWMLGVLLVGAAGGGAVAQGQGESALAESVGGQLRGLASRAGVVFVGQVAKVEAKDGVVEITFTVERPVLGVVGGSYVMREWAGRWTGGRQSFQVGQRAMYFLHAPNAAGLSSAVDGMAGVVPVVGSGEPVLDMRWLATRVRRAQGAALAATSTGGIALAEGVTVAKRWQTERVAEPKSVKLPEGVTAGGSVGGGGEVRKEVGDAQP